MLILQIRELKAKLDGENGESKVMVKEEAVESESEEQKPTTNSLILKEDDTELNLDDFQDGNGGGVVTASLFADFKDGSSDSDSSAILNEDNSPNAAAISSSGAILMISNASSSSFSSPLSMNCYPFSENPKAAAILGDVCEKAAYQRQLVKIEEHNFFGGEDSCSSLFSDEQAPILHWYSPGDWN